MSNVFEKFKELEKTLKQHVETRSIRIISTIHPQFNLEYLKKLILRRYHVKALEK